MVNVEEQYRLSPEQIEHFVQHGWIKLSNCFTQEQAADLQKNLWTRLGMDPDDISTW
jgi:DNA polymerase IIIc chi subunit